MLNENIYIWVPVSLSTHSLSLPFSLFFFSHRHQEWDCFQCIFLSHLLGLVRHYIGNYLSCDFTTAVKWHFERIKQYSNCALKLTVIRFRILDQVKEIFQMCINVEHAPLFEAKFKHIDIENKYRSVTIVCLFVVICEGQITALFSLSYDIVWSN